MELGLVNLVEITNPTAFKCCSWTRFSRIYYEWAQVCGPLDSPEKQLGIRYWGFPMPNAQYLGRSDQDLSIFKLSQIGFKCLTSRIVSQSTSCLLFDLTNPFTGKIEFLPNFFQSHCLLPVQSEVESNNIGLTKRQG